MRKDRKLLEEQGGEIRQNGMLGLGLKNSSSHSPSSFLFLYSPFLFIFISQPSPGLPSGSSSSFSATSTSESVSAHHSCVYSSFLLYFLSSSPPSTLHLTTPILHPHHPTGVLFLLKAFPEEMNAHEMMNNGEIEAPGVGCCNPNMCPSCYF